jgi:hypothetical protein
MAAERFISGVENVFGALGDLVFDAVGLEGIEKGMIREYDTEYEKTDSDEDSGFDMDLFQFQDTDICHAPSIKRRGDGFRFQNKEKRPSTRPELGASDDDHMHSSCSDEGKSASSIQSDSTGLVDYGVKTIVSIGPFVLSKVRRSSRTPSRQLSKGASPLGESRLVRIRFNVSKNSKIGFNPGGRVNKNTMLERNIKRSKSRPRDQRRLEASTRSRSQGRIQSQHDQSLKVVSKS